ncbi:MAG: DUF1579 family protein [Phycisphaerae bacterium]
MNGLTFRGVMVLTAVAALSGCQPTEFDMAEMAAKQKAIPAEMKQLEVFLGKWTSTTETKMFGSDEVMKGSGTSEVKWELGGRYLVGHMTADMGEWGSMEGVDVWTWDPSIKKYRTWWFDDWGMTGSSTATYDPKTRTFRIKGRGRNTLDGSTTVNKGMVTIVDDNTMEWSWAEYDALGLVKHFEMTGTEKRQ